MNYTKHLHKLSAVVMALAMLIGTVPIPAHAVGINDLRPFDTCTNYGATGAGQTETLFQALFPGRFAVVAGGALNGRAAPNSEPVWIVLKNDTAEPFPLGFEVSSGFFCEGASLDAVVNHAGKTGRYVGYLDLPAVATDASAPASDQTAAPESSPASAQSQFVAVSNVMLNRDLSQCRWGTETQKGETKTIGFLVLPGEIGLAFGWAIDGMEGKVRQTFHEGNNIVAITDGFVVVCSTTMALQPEVFEGYKLLEPTSYSLDGQHLFGQAGDAQEGYLKQAAGDWTHAALLWKKAHDEQLIQSRGGKPFLASAQAPPAPTATPQPATGGVIAPTGRPVRFTGTGDAQVNFDKGETVFGAFIRVDGAPNPVGMCFYASAPNSGSVSGGVIGRMPFPQEIQKDHLVSCG